MVMHHTLSLLSGVNFSRIRFHAGSQVIFSTVRKRLTIRPSLTQADFCFSGCYQTHPVNLLSKDKEQRSFPFSRSGHQPPGCPSGPVVIFGGSLVF